ncbi:2-hydroxyacid dehydrogenase [Futiania mangrovi]|uniref:2-hydroxyacid dehydrogenase n=1 Tax=Futiania mangrovi TaxID=2959716 RepID=A0A9J6PIN5_9PROT|nr:2-hydroxyacid dehydrogenase [Futiania mangrovii]MCP1337672.1 2-hydroxyacid dehydrogenase [Futiania mangrovii]
MPARDVLVLPRLPDYVGRALDARFTVHRPWETADPDAALDAVADRIGAVVACPMCDPVTAALIDRLPGLSIVANFGVGYDTVDVAHASRRGLIVTNTPDVLSQETADTAWALVLMAVRRFGHAERWLREGKWERTGPFPLSPLSMLGRTVGVAGLGRIGGAIARRAAASDVEVAYTARTPKPDVPYAYYPDILSLAAAVDTLVLATPGGPETQNLVDARVLDALGPRGVLVNIARGSVVDQEALIAALKEGRIAAAGLDVYTDEPQVPAELMSLDNAVLFPHVGSSTQATREAMADIVVDNLVAWEEGRPPPTPVAETPFSGWS